MKKKTISKYKWDRIRDSVHRRDVQRFGVYDKHGCIDLVIFDIYLKGFLYRHEYSCRYWGGYGRPVSRWYRYDLREV